MTVISQTAQALEAAILAGDTSEVPSMLPEWDGPAPRLVWRPREDQLIPAPLRFLHEFWHRRHREGDLPGVDAINPMDLKPALGHVMILDPVDHCADFRYRLYGSEIAQRTSFDVTGKKLSEHPEPCAMRTFLMAGYRAVSRNRETLLTIHRAVPHVAYCDWHRLILPFAIGDTQETRILTGCIACPVGGE